MTHDMSRLGQFTITVELIQAMDLGRWAAFCSTFVPTYVDYDPDRSVYHYIATSLQFSELTDVAPIPEYTSEWNKEEGRFVWIRLKPLF